jgi:hypothetical protein
MFNWISAFRKLPDQFVLNHQTLDNYLFIRYFRMLTYICLVGTIITWVFLLRVNYNGGGGQSELDTFTFSNVTDPDKFYWHAGCAWVFLGFVMFIITKETLYYINLRQAYLTTPRNATRMSTRVVLFTGVPEDMRHERWIKADFFGVKRVWLATDCTELETLVDTMNNTAISLEEAEIKLSNIATKKHLKGEKHFADDVERAGTATQQWIVPKERPSKRIALVGRKLDAIEMYREQLKATIPKVAALQKRHVQGYEKLLPAAFVEFETQRAAQLAYSDPFWKQPGKMEAATIGISSPDEIVWANLAIGKPERWARTIIANTIVVLLIVFWSLPVGLVGSLADIDNLSKNFPPLGFVNKLPSSTKGAISGLLPTLLISAILALVPIICRCKLCMFLDNGHKLILVQSWPERLGLSHSHRSSSVRKDGTLPSKLYRSSSSLLSVRAHRLLLKKSGTILLRPLNSLLTTCPPLPPSTFPSSSYRVLLLLLRLSSRLFLS